MTVDKKYGRIFKQLRKQRELKITAFQEYGISPATISKFENGKTRVSFDKFQIMLRTLSVTLGEYLTFEGDLTDKNFYRHERLLDNIATAVLKGDSSEFKSCQSEAIKLQEYHLSLALKGMQSPLELDEIGTLSEYFDQIKYWRNADLFTFYLSTDQLKLRQSVYILEGFFIGKEGYVYSAEYDLSFFHIACHVISSLIKIGNPEMAQHFMRYLSARKYTHTMYTKNLLAFVEGYWIAKFQNKENGIQQLKNSLNVFKQLQDPIVFQFYERLFNKYLSDLN